MERSQVRRSRNLVLHFMKIFGELVSILIFACTWFLVYDGQMTHPYMAKGNMALIVLYGILDIVMTRVYGGYNVGRMRVSELIYSQMLASMLTAFCSYIVTVLLCERLVNPVGYLLMLLVQGIWIALWMVACHRQFSRQTVMRTAVVIYRNEQDLDSLKEIPFFSSKYDVRLKIKDPANFKDFMQQLEKLPVKAERIFILGISATVRNGILKYCLDHDIKAYTVPKIGDLLMDGGKRYCYGGQMFTLVQRQSPSLEYRFIKRAMDVVAALLGIIITSPLMLGVAIAIKSQDGGPILYRQKRLTLNGKVFEVLKFRSMRCDAEKDGVARLASEHDDRITPVGRVIRACRLDELPQLFNILCGDMTLVGPRPERPEIAEKYKTALPAFSLRLQAKAGLTGYAQVYGKYNTAPYEKLSMDLYYINHMSLGMDLKLMIATVKILFMKDSTEGVAAGQTTAASAGNEEKSA